MEKWMNSSEKIIKYRKYRDFYDIHLFEVWFSLIFAAVIVIVCTMISLNCGINKFVNSISSRLSDTSIAMIGYLGFVVAALAILTGSISSKVLGRLRSRKKIEPLERIMLSFFLLGIICGCYILISLTLYFVSNLPIPSALIIIIIFSFLLSYMLSWIVIYSVKLIGDCIDLFLIVGEMDNLEDNRKDYQALYEKYRVTALEKAVLKQTNIEYFEAYKKELIDLIENDSGLSVVDKNELLNMVKIHFGE